jgi:quinol monooxygenase YgiN
MYVLMVDFKVKPGSEDECRRLMRLMVEHSNREPGCRQYIGHQSTEDPRRFCFYEQYDDAAALEAHRATPHFQQYVTNGLATITEERQAHTFNVLK